MVTGSRTSERLTSPPPAEDAPVTDALSIGRKVRHFRTQRDLTLGRLGARSRRLDDEPEDCKKDLRTQRVSLTEALFVCLGYSVERGRGALLTWMATSTAVMSICDFGLMKDGRLADLRAESKMREIRFVLTSSDAYMSEKPKLTCAWLLLLVWVGRVEMVEGEKQRGRDEH